MASCFVTELPHSDRSPVTRLVGFGFSKGVCFGSAGCHWHRSDGFPTFSRFPNRTGIVVPTVAGTTATTFWIFLVQVPVIWRMACPGLNCLMQRVRKKKRAPLATPQTPALEPVKLGVTQTEAEREVVRLSRSRCRTLLPG